jgi:hypothetical protein
MLAPKPSRGAERWRNPVTIAIGFAHPGVGKYPSAIHLASDSRISTGVNVTHDGKKIDIVKFKDGAALIACAGYQFSFARFLEIFAERAAGISVASPRAIPNAAEDAIRDLQRELLDRHVGDKDQRLRDSYCEFILAFYSGSEAKIYTLNLFSRVCEKARHNFVAIGNGAALANFLLTSITLAKLNARAAIDAALSVIEMCKLHDSSCGGPCMVGMIAERGDPAVFPQVTMKGLARKLHITKQGHAELMRRFASNFR